MRFTDEDAHRLRGVVNADVRDDGARILLHRAINQALAPELELELRAALVELLAIVRRDGGYMPAVTQLRLREIERLTREQADGARIVQPQLDGE